MIFSTRLSKKLNMYFFLIRTCSNDYKVIFFSNALDLQWESKTSEKADFGEILTISFCYYIYIQMKLNTHNLVQRVFSWNMTYIIWNSRYSNDKYYLFYELQLCKYLCDVNSQKINKR